jgi:hypothetical protein
VNLSFVPAPVPLPAAGWLLVSALGLPWFRKPQASKP